MHEKGSKAVGAVDMVLLKIKILHNLRCTTHVVGSRILK